MSRFVLVDYWIDGYCEGEDDAPVTPSTNTGGRTYPPVLIKRDHYQFKGQGLIIAIEGGSAKYQIRTKAAQLIKTNNAFLLSELLLN